MRGVHSAVLVGFLLLLAISVIGAICYHLIIFDEEEACITSLLGRHVQSITRNYSNSRYHWVPDCRHCKNGRWEMNEGEGGEVTIESNCSRGFFFKKAVKEKYYWRPFENSSWSWENRANFLISDENGLIGARNSETMGFYSREPEGGSPRDKSPHANYILILSGLLISLLVIGAIIFGIVYVRRIICNTDSSPTQSRILEMQTLFKKNDAEE